jgi:hypothetical protein
MWVFLGDGGDNFAGAVGTVVVHHNDFVGDIERIEDAAYMIQKAADVLSLRERGNDQRQLFVHGMLFALRGG